MIETSKGLFSAHTDELGAPVVVALLREALSCRCGRMAVLVVNRGGVTRCSDCDMKFKQ